MNKATKKHLHNNLYKKLKEVSESDASKYISEEIKRNNAMINAKKENEYSKYIAERVSRDIDNSEIPQYIKDIVQSRVFNYLDEIGLEYVKAESSVINHNGLSLPIIISYPGFAKHVRLKVLKSEKIEDMWRRIETDLPGAILNAIKTTIDKTLNLGIPVDSLRRAVVVPNTYGFGPDNLRDYTILFKDFSGKIAEIPISMTEDMYIDSYRGASIGYTHYSISSYFELVHKSQNGITPLLTNQIVEFTSVKEEESEVLPDYSDDEELSIGLNSPFFSANDDYRRRKKKQKQRKNKRK
ncbi:MAG TPA: hypothetical protein VMZ91_12215 [Candidatus Paceibacterota bacterium]|nr:hypothetical protein [Candidatus Paceibacterota bacterium]